MLVRGVAGEMDGIGETYERHQNPQQFCYSADGFLTEDLLVCQLLADRVVAQSQQRDVRIVCIVALKNSDRHVSRLCLA